MRSKVKSDRVVFRLPEKEVLEPNGPDDPLPYYYKPLVRSLYHARIQKTLSLLTPPYASILEIGYGSGVLMPTLHSIADTVHGIDLMSDPEKTRANLAKIGIDVSLMKADINDLDQRDESFDLVVSISVMEHIENPSPVIQKIWHLLRPGGSFLVGMPRVDPIFSKAFHLVERGYPIEKHHVTTYHQVMKATVKQFTLAGFSHLPAFLPRCMGIYFSMLFQKAVPEQLS